MFKKLLLLFLMLHLFAGCVSADERSFTVRNGVRTMYGYMPTSSSYGGYTDCDPYFFEIGGVTYYMLRDNGDNYNRKSLLGCSESKRTLFNPLESLNSDGDREHLTPSELRRANIRFVKLKTNGKLAVYDRDEDFDLDRIAYVDLRRVRFSLSATPMGCFDIYILRESGSTRKVIARVSAISHYKADKMF